MLINTPCRSKLGWKTFVSGIVMTRHELPTVAYLTEILPITPDFFDFFSRKYVNTLIPDDIYYITIKLKTKDLFTTLSRQHFRKGI